MTAMERKDSLSRYVSEQLRLPAQLEAARRGEPLAEALRRFLVDYAARRDLREN